jgi:plasmid stabilization system protein ParE
MTDNKILWVHSALEDLINIKTYIEKSSPKYAKIQIKRLIQKVSLLKKNIRAGSSLENFNDKEVRYLILGNYKIIYLVYSIKEAHILRGWHTSRDFNSIRDLK